jgi:hypothetical protein
MNLRDAINEVLLSLNELPLDVADAVEDVPVAVIVDQSIAIAKKKVLGKGWYFNTLDLELIPNTDGYIPIPFSFLSLDGGDAEPNLTVRDWKLFDKSTLSFKFEDNKSVQVIEDIPFDDIPFMTANYIVAMASLQSYTDIIGDESGIRIKREALIEAKIDAMREDANSTDGNLLNDAHATALLDRTSL